MLDDSLTFIQSIKAFLFWYQLIPKNIVLLGISGATDWENRILRKNFLQNLNR